MSFDKLFTRISSAFDSRQGFPSLYTTCASPIDKLELAFHELFVDCRRLEKRSFQLHSSFEASCTCIITNMAQLALRTMLLPINCINPLITDKFQISPRMNACSRRNEDSFPRINLLLICCPGTERNIRRKAYFSRIIEARKVLVPRKQRDKYLARRKTNVWKRGSSLCSAIPLLLLLLLLLLYQAPNNRSITRAFTMPLLIEDHNPARRSGRISPTDSSSSCPLPALTRFFIPRFVVSLSL